MIFLSIMCRLEERTTDENGRSVAWEKFSYWHMQSNTNNAIEHQGEIFTENKETVYAQNYRLQNCVGFFFFICVRGGHQSSAYYSPSCFDLNLRIGIKVTRFEQWNKNKTLAVELNEALCAGWAPSPGHYKLNPPDKELFLIACWSGTTEQHT